MPERLMTKLELIQLLCVLIILISFLIIIIELSKIYSFGIFAVSTKNDFDYTCEEMKEKYGYCAGVYNCEMKWSNLMILKKCEVS